MDVLSRAEALLEEIQAETSRTSSGNVPPIDVGAGVGASPRSGSGSGTGTEQNQELISKAREMVEVLTVQIQTSATAADESKLERLLALCDQLNGGVDTLTSRASRRSLVHGLGLKLDGLSGAGGVTTVQDEDGDVLLTPRVDKGKGRAEPEPDEPEKVLSPTFMITESEDEDEDDHRYLDVEEGDGEEIGLAASPTDRYVRVPGGGGERSWLTCDV